MSFKFMFCTIVGITTRHWYRNVKRKKTKIWQGEIKENQTRRETVTFYIISYPCNNQLFYNTVKINYYWKGKCCVRAHLCLHANLQIAMALKNHKEKQGKKFTPPLKKLVTSPALTLDYSCSEGASWSLPHTQTHTVLSYCNDKIDDLACPTPSQRKFSSKYRRHYQYSIHPPNTSRGNLKIQARAQTKGTNCTGLFNIYDYPLTPQNKTEMKVKPVRSKQQASISSLS